MDMDYKTNQNYFISDRRDCPRKNEKRLSYELLSKIIGELDYR